MKCSAKEAPGRGLFFPDWAGALRADESLTPGLRECYRRVLAGFLEFCRQRRADSSVALARDYVELARLEQAPAPARLQEWKDGLNWFFRRGREASSAALLAMTRTATVAPVDRLANWICRTVNRKTRNARRHFPLRGGEGHRMGEGESFSVSLKFERLDLTDARARQRPHSDA